MTDQLSLKIVIKKTSLLLILLVSSTNLYPQIINTIAGNGIQNFSGDFGLAINAELSSPTDVATDKIGNVYIADSNNSRIRKIDTLGIITTIAGNGLLGFSGDGGPAISATLGRPSSVTLDSIGNIYLYDRDNNRIRKIDTAGIITTIGGNGNNGYTGDGGSALSATLGVGAGIESDKAGNIFIADFDNQVIRKINTAGVISTIAGNGTPGNSGDGGLAINAQLNYPNWLTVDKYGNIYISDMNNNKIRKIDTSGIITTIAGNNFGSAGFGGDGGPATSALLYQPQGITVDGSGNVYFSDYDRIRVVNTSGIINTYAGNGTLGFSGDGGIATYANIGGRAGICSDNNNNIYLAESYTQRVRKVGAMSTSTGSFILNDYFISVYPNPNSGIFIIESNKTENQILEIIDTKGILISKYYINAKNKIDLSHLSNGIYTLIVKTDTMTSSKKLVILK